MLQYATWKYVVAAIVIALSVFYSLPNLYPKDPAVQVAANRGSVVDDLSATVYCRSNCSRSRSTGSTRWR